MNEKTFDMLLWSFYGQFEPTIAITTKFHMVGILGLETFRSDKAYMAEVASSLIEEKDPRSSEVNQYLYKKAPINYRETAVGLGIGGKEKRQEKKMNVQLPGGSADVDCDVRGWDKLS